MPFRSPPNTSIDISIDTLTPGLASNLPVYLRHNWARPYRVSSRFLTGISTSKYSGAESRTGLRSRPVREVETLATSLDLDSNTRQRLYMHRLGTDETLLYPLECDAAQITAVGTGPGGAGTQLSVDTIKYKRFLDGQYVLLVPDDGSTITDASLGNERVPTLVGVILNTPNATTVNLVSAPPVDIPVGWCVVPAFVGLPSIQLGSDLHTAGISELVYNYEEVAGDTALPPTKLSEDMSGEGFDYYQGLPVFDPEHDFNSDAKPQSQRAGTVFELDRSRAVVLDGTEPRVLYGTVSTFFERAGWYRLLRFWESRKASLRGFWLVGPEVWWDTAISVSSGVSTIQVPKRGYEADVEALLKAIHVEYTDGTVWTREVTDIAKVPASDLLELTLESPSPSAGTVLCIRPAWVSRFASDEFKETWQSASICNVELNTVSLLDEEDHELSQ